MPTLRFVPGNAVVHVEKGARLVDAIRDAGLPIARACGDDLICALCGVAIVEGDVAAEKRAERRAKARNRVRSDLRLACAIRVQRDLVVTADYW